MTSLRIHGLAVWPTSEGSPTDIGQPTRWLSTLFAVYADSTNQIIIKELMQSYKGFFIYPNIFAFFCGSDETRTRTGISAQGILSPSCLHFITEPIHSSKNWCKYNAFFLICKLFSHLFSDISQSTPLSRLDNGSKWHAQSSAMLNSAFDPTPYYI